MKKVLLGLALSLTAACVSGSFAGDPTSDDEQVSDDAEEAAPTPSGEDKTVIIIERATEECLKEYLDGGTEEDFTLCLDDVMPADLSRRDCDNVCARIEHECDHRPGCQEVWCLCDAICDIASDYRARPGVCH